MQTIDPTIATTVDVLQRNAAGRDDRMRMVGKVRDGQMHELWPDYFSKKYPQAVVANFIDVVARDVAECIAPLPTLNCASGAMKTEADKRRAEKKNRIGEHYWRTSQLDSQMFSAADQYLTYGFMPVWIEADYDNQHPIIHMEDPVGAYYESDRWGCVRKYARVWRQRPSELATMFPEAAVTILMDKNGRPRPGDVEIDVVRYIDDQIVVMYLPARNGVVLAQYSHGMEYCPVHVAQRPGLRSEPRGQFDDVLWVQLAKAVMAGLTLEAGHKAVQAPIVVPTDTQEITLGPDAIMRTDKGDQVHRVQLEVPNAAFALGQQLDEELKTGARYPDARLGVAQASVITGKGVQALLGSYDTQISAAQTVMAKLLRDVTGTCFKMDQRLWPNKIELIQGTLSGHSYEVKYTPSIDINNNFTCDVTYGFASGMSPQNALVTMLQARGDGLIGRDTVRRQLPWGLDAEQEQRDLDVQETEDALKQGVFSAMQSAGQMMAQGMLPEAMLFFTMAAAVIKGRQNGEPIADIVTQTLQAYQQQQQQQQAAAAAAQQGAPGGASPDGIDGVSPDGLPPGVAPGQAGLGGVGGQPSVQQLTAAMSGSGAANMTDTLRKRLPVSS